MGNRTLLFAAAAFFATGTLAAAFNPQPDPPGRHLNTVNTNAQFEPPDPCLANQHSLQVRKAGGTQMYVRNAGGTQIHARKAGGTQMPGHPYACVNRGNPHALNPQPLPPG